MWNMHREINHRLAVVFVLVLLGSWSRAIAQAPPSVIDGIEGLSLSGPSSELAQKLIVAIRAEEERLIHTGRYGPWVIENARRRFSIRVDATPRQLSVEATTALAGFLGDAYTTVFRARRLIELADAPEQVFAACATLGEIVELRLPGAEEPIVRWRDSLHRTIEGTLIALPGSPPWTPGDSMAAAGRVVEDVCADVKSLQAQQRKKGMSSHDFNLKRGEAFNASLATLSEGLGELRSDALAGVRARVALTPWAWGDVGSGASDEMLDIVSAARAMPAFVGWRELSGAQLPGFPDRTRLEHLDQTSSESVSWSLALLGSLSIAAANAAEGMADGTMRSVDCVWSEDGVARMACDATIVRTSTHVGLVFGPVTVVSPAPKHGVGSHGPVALDVLAGTSCIWALDGTGVALHLPVEGSGWRGGGQWGWQYFVNDPTPGWILDLRMVESVLAACVRNGVSNSLTDVPVKSASFVMHYDFRTSGLPGVGEFDRVTQFEIFREPTLRLAAVEGGALAAAQIGSHCELALFADSPLQSISTDALIASVLDGCDERTQMRIIVEADLGMMSSEDAIAHSDAFLASGDRLASFVIDDALIARACSREDPSVSAAALARLYTHLGAPFDAPFRKHLDAHGSSLAGSQCMSFVRTPYWLVKLPEELLHPRVRAKTSTDASPVK